MKTLLILIGPKGAGKSHFGRLIEKNLHFKFLAVELIYLRIQNGRSNLDENYRKEGQEAVHKEILEIFKVLQNV